MATHRSYIEASLWLQRGSQSKMLTPRSSATTVKRHVEATSISHLASPSSPISDCANAARSHFGLRSLEAVASRAQAHAALGVTATRTLAHILIDRVMSWRRRPGQEADILEERLVVH
eukprot:CAMPEP_0181233358 /NCGR_PEP_ID=MMETSP1096-20121128/36288_1 /TAXON_ID=156174 ORGANISM="Chrysochromulina ericina, Strain CCMP281" /NCGR_SAMPLE_ID=MMETSP1096 /ASSEMBLY_ACC=CAM_ASM_000453 /LENGTH=117 /DNA_ID=CAMNT_0023327843 /DNA_START=169 /DNA_END=524 /DNA_ORIENTATION=+